MKARVWKSKNGRVRVVERFNKAKAASVFDVQVRKHLMWFPELTGCSADYIKARFGLEIEMKFEGKPEFKEKE